MGWDFSNATFLMMWGCYNANCHNITDPMFYPLQDMQLAYIIMVMLVYSISL